jgi:hypothetical protein
MKIGDKIQQKITANKDLVRKIYLGTVVYINRDNGWYMLEFVFGKNKIRECYFI